MTDDDIELPEGYTWDDFRAEAERINAFKAAHPNFPGGPVTPEHLVRCTWEELRFEAREEAKWAALTPVEQAAMKALESAADAEIETILDIGRAAMRRRGVVTARDLMKVMLPTDPDFAQVTAAMRRLAAIDTMFDEPEAEA